MTVPNLVVVLLCVIGAGAVVTAIAAFGKSLLSRGEEPQVGFNQRSAEQDSYLRRVREMNQVQIWGVVRAGRREDRRQRERDLSDVEVQSGVSYNGPSGYPHRNSGYHSEGYRQSSVQYEEYVQPSNMPAYYEERRPYSGGQGSAYAMKGGPAETWSEVPRQ